MPSQKPRIALTLDTDLNDLLADLSVLMKKPKSTIITELLVDVAPMLTDIRDALRLAEQKKDVKPVLARMAASANIIAADMNNDLLSELNKGHSHD